MRFQYYIYRRAGLFVPVFMMIFAGVIVIVSLLFYTMKSKHSLPAFLSTVAPTFGLLAFFIIICFPTIKYSIYLFHEKESDALLSYGTVENIIPVENSPRYSTEEDGVVRAVFLIVDKEKYYCMTGKGLSKGDYVTFRFLPQSRMILSWEKNDR